MDREALKVIRRGATLVAIGVAWYLLQARLVDWRQAIAVFIIILGVAIAAEGLLVGRYGRGEER